MKCRRNPPGFLILKGEDMEIWLNSKGKTVRNFSGALDIGMAEAYGILSGESVGFEIARRFINYYGADFVHGFINWEAMGMTDPYPKSRKRHIKMRHYDRRRIN